MLAMTAMMSSRVATATWTFMPVWISTSSMATTFAGSAMATTRVSAPTRATGTSSQRRASSPGRRLTAAMSSRYCVRIEKVQAEPLGDGLAPRCSAVITPLVDEELIRRGAGVAGGEHRRLDALARSRSRASTMTSVRKRMDPPTVPRAGVTAP